MTLRIVQKATWERPDWWSWSVWLKGAPGELRRVRSMTYVLHPTFPNPVREVRDARSAFRLDSAGWGGFTIRATAHLAGGRSVSLKHELVLRRPEGPAAPRKRATREHLAPAGGRGAGPKVFLSFSRADAAVAERVRAELSAQGVATTDASGRLGITASIAGEIAARVRASDAVLSIRSDAPSLWADVEIATAKRSGVPIIPVYVGEVSPPPGESDVEAIRVGTSPGTDELGTQVAALVARHLGPRGA